MVKELNLPPAASQGQGNGFTDRREEHHPHHENSHPLPPAVSLLPAPPTGFEPVTFSLTVRRALRAAPRGRSPESTIAPKAEAVGLEPTRGSCRDLFSKQAPHPAGWLPSRLDRREFRGLESNQRPPRSERGVAPSSNYPGITSIPSGPLDPSIESSSPLHKGRRRTPGRCSRHFFAKPARSSSPTMSRRRLGSLTLTREFSEETYAGDQSRRTPA